MLNQVLCLFINVILSVIVYVSYYMRREDSSTRYYPVTCEIMLERYNCNSVWRSESEKGLSASLLIYT